MRATLRGRERPLESDCTLPRGQWAPRGLQPSAVQIRAAPPLFPRQLRIQSRADDTDRPTVTAIVTASAEQSEAVVPEELEWTAFSSHMLSEAVALVNDRALSDRMRSETSSRSQICQSACAERAARDCGLAMFDRSRHFWVADAVCFAIAVRTFCGPNSSTRLHWNVCVPNRTGSRSLFDCYQRTRTRMRARPVPCT